ncbi:hypothetical protein [Alicyclobacillus fastidiosus]|uniref:Uncharacterized protein n=1 Tax=Alicyclobacillus fastidiosus TaxID=392011 RepID=A0ABV5AAW0_9BACL|nr:hypothetical protein [Alicyclobacillus fastidiosus]WEH11829.1 hypothetical protein PYS47_11765 [Alicyclobacillus fastidiosus]
MKPPRMIVVQNNRPSRETVDRWHAYLREVQLRAARRKATMRVDDKKNTPQMD